MPESKLPLPIHYQAARANLDRLESEYPDDHVIQAAVSSIRKILPRNRCQYQLAINSDNYSDGQCLLDADHTGAHVRPLPEVDGAEIHWNAHL